MKTIVLLVLLILASGCVASVEASEPWYRLAPCEVQGEDEHGNAHPWARFEVPGESAFALAEARALLHPPHDVNEPRRISADPALRWYVAPIVLIDDGVIDVFCGEGEDASTEAALVMPWKR